MENITIIGGTGTLGSELVKRFYHDEDKYITIISRDEYKQAKMKKEYPHCRYVLADIRDSDFPQQIEEIAEYTDFVFHCAALKHVDLGETNVEQFIKTNLTGTINVFRAFGIHTDINFFSTDKAVLPINAYGMSKALAEKFLLNATQNCKI